MRIHNLELVARAISYTAEAAVVFDDEEAAKDALEAITSREDIASASIVLPDGRVLASWRRSHHHPLDHAGAAPGPPHPAGARGAAMVREHREIARVHLVGHGQFLLRFLLQTLLATLVCLLLQHPRALHVARRMQRSITAPLKALTEVAYNVSRQRALKQRVPAANIANCTSSGGLQLPARRAGGLAGPSEAGERQPVHRATHDALTGLPNRPCSRRVWGRPSRRAAPSRSASP